MATMGFKFKDALADPGGRNDVHPSQSNFFASSLGNPGSTAVMVLLYV